MNAEEINRQCTTIVFQLVAGEASQLTSERLEGALDRVIRMLSFEYPEHQFERDSLLRFMESQLNIFQPGATSMIDDSNHLPWLERRRSSIDWVFWDRYLRYQREKENLPPRVLDRLDQSTIKVLEKLEDPQRPGTWERYGLVVGQVQSGKTGNFIGLVCRAVDAGYKLIVVLAGLNNNLRSQTQLRLDQGFLGFDTQRRIKASADPDQSGAALGVGRVLGAPQPPVASLTTSADKGDFTSQRANSAGIMLGTLPVVLVLKKHGGILRNLAEWVDAYATGEGSTRTIKDVPLLLIDDEADNASMNTRETLDSSGAFDPDSDPTAVNQAIRLLLKKFDKKAYVGYTATPYANLYASNDRHPTYGYDLFPRHFIDYLRPPSNYFGPRRIFGPDGDINPQHLHRELRDTASWIPEKHKADLIVGPIPESLRQAIKAFVLARAIRLARGQVNKHNSMLVHVTRFTNVQNQIRSQVEDELEDLRATLKFGAGRDYDPWIELEKLWIDDFREAERAMAEPRDQLEWGDISAHVRESVEAIQIRTINGSARDALEYFENEDTGFNVIAIGGDKLSRGLTLDGLTISYYLRASRTYDTLFQMGRWFGYRNRYEDVCRIYTSGGLWRAYTEVCVANEELIEEFEEMALRRVGPTAYGLKVRDSANGLLVTAPNKMRLGSKLRVGFSGAISETTVLPCGNRDADYNHSVADEFITELRTTVGQPDVGRSSNHVWKDVPGDSVCDVFLRRFKTLSAAWRVNSQLMASYVSAQIARDELTKWTVALINNMDPKSPSYEIGGIFGKATNRKNMIDTRDRVLSGAYPIRRILNPSDEWLDFDDREVEELTRAAVSGWNSDPGRRTKEPTEPTGPIVRRARPVDRGLLILYPLAAPSKVADATISDVDAVSAGLTLNTMVGFACSFPVSSTEVTVEYVVNERFLGELRGDDE